MDNRGDDGRDLTYDESMYRITKLLIYWKSYIGLWLTGHWGAALKRFGIFVILVFLVHVLLIWMIHYVFLPFFKWWFQDWFFARFAENLRYLHEWYLPF